jgi:hypothetical protein
MLNQLAAGKDQAEQPAAVSSKRRTLRTVTGDSDEDDLDDLCSTYELEEAICSEHTRESDKKWLNISTRKNRRE